MSEDVAELVGQLRRFHVPVAAMIAIAEEELAGRFRLEQELTEGTSSHLAFRRLLVAVSGDSQSPLLTQIVRPQSAGVFQLLREPDLAKVFGRHYTTDKNIHIVLPLMLTYVRTVGEFSVEHTFDEVRAALRMSRNDRRALHTTINVARPTVLYDLAHLFEGIRSETIDLFPAFDLSTAALRRFYAGKLVLHLVADVQTVRLGEPLRVQLSLRNTSSMLIEAIDPCGFADAKGAAPLQLVVESGGKRYRIMKGFRPTIVNTRRPATSRLSRIFLEPGSSTECSVIIGIDWQSARAALALDQADEYTLTMEYFPVWRAEGGSELLDTDPVLSSNSARILVMPLEAKCQNCWARIRAASYWWVLYYPDGSSLEALSDDEISLSHAAFRRLASACRGCVFEPYLAYTELLLKSMMVRGARMSQFDVQRLRGLAAARRFQYRFESARLLSRVGSP